MSEIMFERGARWRRTPVLERLSLVLKRLTAAAERRASQRAQRAALLSLKDLDDTILADIGVERADIDWALALPPEVDAGQALRRRAAWRQRVAYEAWVAAGRRPRPSRGGSPARAQS